VVKAEQLSSNKSLPPVKGAILELFLGGYEAHPSRRIWQLSAAIKTANVLESAPTIASRPGRATMDAVKHVRQNPFDALHEDTLAEACRTGGAVRLRSCDLSARRINWLSFLRARADCAFTVPSGTPRIRAASWIDRPSI
jgi:hypothetical protein